MRAWVRGSVGACVRACVCVRARTRVCVCVCSAFFKFIFYNTLCKLFWSDYALHVHRISYLGQHVSCERSGR